jgi:hypothetical protein
VRLWLLYIPVVVLSWYLHSIHGDLLRFFVELSLFTSILLVSLVAFDLRQDLRRGKISRERYLFLKQKAAGLLGAPLGIGVAYAILYLVEFTSPKNLDAQTSLALGIGIACAIVAYLLVEKFRKVKQRGKMH